MVLTVFRNTKIVTADQKNNLPTLFKVVYLFLNPIVAAIFPIGVLGLIPSTRVLSVRFERIGFRKTRFAILIILTEYIDLICILELSFGFNQRLKISILFEVKPKKSFQKIHEMLNPVCHLEREDKMNCDKPRVLRRKNAWLRSYCH